MQLALKNIAQHLRAEKIKSAVLKDHSRIPAIIDILIRRERHHVLLTGSVSEKMNHALMEALVLQLTDTHTPKSIRNAQMIYIDAAKLATQEIILELHARDFTALREEIRDSKKCIILAINRLHTLRSVELHTYLDKLMKSVLNDNQWRVVLFASQEHLLPNFTALQLDPSSHHDLLKLLKSLRSELENFHQVVIPDETLTSALSLATHYLPGFSRIDEAAELLDSSAARASANEQSDTSGSHKPVVTNNLLAQVVSSRTHIPVSHLHNNQFQAAQYIPAMRQCIYGQDAAIALIGSLLQNACVKLHKKSGPLCNFLLVGPTDVGKAESAFAMADHLFGHAGALLRVNLCNTHHTSINDIKIISESRENRIVSLLEAIAQTPYAVVLIEEINQAPADILELFNEILIHGYTVDADGTQYDFRNAIIVMTTTLGTEAICQLMQAPAQQETSKSVDLMQLVLNKNLNDANSHNQHQISSEEICNEIIPALETYFPSTLLQCLNIIPFIPLEYSALEKIVLLKIKLLAKQLDVKFGIELNYASEVVKFIAHEVLLYKATSQSLAQLLEQHLYSCVAQEILAHTENKNRSKRLTLQLNNNGQLLRCEFMATNETGIYAL